MPPSKVNLTYNIIYHALYSIRKLAKQNACIIFYTFYANYLLDKLSCAHSFTFLPTVCCSRTAGNMLPVRSARTGLPDQTARISPFCAFSIRAVPAARIRLAREQHNIAHCMDRTVMHDIQILSLETFANHFAAVPYLSVATLSFMPLE